MSDARARKLECWLGDRLPNASRIEITEMRQASSGLSNETLLFTLNYDDPKPHSERLVLRCLPAKTTPLFPDYDLGIQAGVMRALASTEVRTPVVRWYEPDAAALGSEFFVMEFVEGETPSDATPGFHGHGMFYEGSCERRRHLWCAMLAEMVKLHALDWLTLDLPTLPGMAAIPAQSMASQIALLEKWARWGRSEDIPLIAAGLDHLKSTPVRSKRLALVWGDARPGNVLYRNDAVAAIFDWELATIGPPALDIFQAVWATEMLAELNDREWLPGIPGRTETLEIYEKLSGRPLEDLLYAEIFCLLKLSIMAVLSVRAALQENYTDDYIMTNPALKALEVMLSR